jgi:hypothetical protein
MIPELFISALSLLIGECKAKSDNIQSNPIYRMDTWKYKYKCLNSQPMKHKTRKYNKIHALYIKLFNVKYRERFLLSTTLLVWITDNWHFVNTVRHILCMILLFVLVFIGNPPSILIIVPIFYLLGFHISNYFLD